MILKAESKPTEQSIQNPQPQPQNNKSTFIPTNYNRPEFGETFSNSSETKQTPIIFNLDTQQYNFSAIEPEYEDDVFQSEETKEEPTILALDYMLRSKLTRGSVFYLY